MRLLIKHQLLLQYLVILVTIIGLTITISFWTTGVALRHQILHRMQDVGKSLQSAKFPFTQSVLSQLQVLSQHDIYWRSKTVQLSTLPSAKLIPLEPSENLNWKSMELLGPVTIGPKEFLYSALVIQNENADGTLYLLFDCTKLQEWQRMVILPAAVAAIIGTAVVLLFIGLWSSYTVKRIDRLSLQANSIATGKFQPVPVSGNDEISKLAHGINRMCDQLKEYEQKVKEAESSRLVAQLNGALIHHMRNGIAGAKLALQYQQKVPEDAEAVHVALRQLTIVEEKLRRFLQFGHQIKEEKTDVSLEELLAATIRLLKPKSDHLSTSVHFESKGPVKLRGCSQQLEQVFINLIDNAIDAAGPGGTVRVVQSQDNDIVRCVIVDSGTGVRDEVRSKLFHPFFSTKQDGMGLGLAVSRDIIQQHQGSIEYSRSEKDTCFVVHLPLREKPCLE